MELTFTKLHGLGNDFIFIDDMAHKIDLTAQQVAYLCDRHFGIGADGVILVRPASTAEGAGYMHYINSDGTLAQMCGNGVRCTAKFLVDNGFVAKNSGKLIVDTLSGSKAIEFSLDENGKLAFATVDMGQPILDPAWIPVSIGTNKTTADGVAFVGDYPLESPWGSFAFTMVSMGNPHAVCFVEDWASIDDRLFVDPSEKSLDSLDLNLIGAFFESHPVFLEKSNIEFAQVYGDTIAMRVYERGCGETLACGTGACATRVAAGLTERSSREGDVELRGGTLHIAWNPDGHVFMTGPATESFSGTVSIV